MSKKPTKADVRNALNDLATNVVGIIQLSDAVCFAAADFADLVMQREGNRNDPILILANNALAKALDDLWKYHEASAKR